MFRQSTTIRHVVLSCIFVSSLYAIPAQASASTDYSRVHALYGDSIAFDVYRNGSLVGEQTVRFSEQGSSLAVDINFHLEIKALYITFYKMTYSSKSLWQNDKMTSLAARTDRNGTKSIVDAKAKGTVLVGDGPDGDFSTPLGTYPTDHWNAGVIGSTKLINTINGHVNDIRLVAMGQEDITTNRGPVNATHYKYEGEIKNDVWYDQDGRWVHMSFSGDDGSLIEFRCRKCVPETVALAD